MAVRNRKCHFVSEHATTDQFNYKKSILFYYKETGHVDANNINSDSMYEMSTGCFYARLCLLRNGSIAALIGP